jgi:hypothetical protein
LSPFLLRQVWVVGALVLPAAALAGEDLEAGKSGPAIFAADCAACHRSPQGLAQRMSSGALMDFLREHYTTGAGHAGKIAAYLLTAGGDARRARANPVPDAQTRSTAYPGEQIERRPAYRASHSAPAMMPQARSPFSEPEDRTAMPNERASRRSRADRAPPPQGGEASPRLKQGPSATNARVVEPEQIRSPEAPAVSAPAIRPEASIAAGPSQQANPPASATETQSNQAASAPAAAAGTPRAGSAQDHGDHPGFGAPSP